jgi:hypothetical protein
MCNEYHKMHLVGTGVGPGAIGQDRKGYIAWCDAGRPAEGWTQGLGSTGHSSRTLFESPCDVVVEADCAFDAGAVKEPTSAEYLLRAEQCISNLQHFCASGIGHEGLNSDPQPGNSATKQSGARQMECEGRASTCKTAPKPEGGGNRQRASDFFSVVAGTDCAEAEGDLQAPELASGEDRRTAGDTAGAVSRGGAAEDGMVYSRVHGYRIKINEAEDTTLAYKKVLGDINVSGY